MTTEPELFPCKDCGELYPREDYGNAKLRHTRCAGVNTNRCHQAERRAYRLRTVPPRIMAEVSIENLIQEMTDHKRYDLTGLTKAEKAERDRLRIWLSNILTNVPDYLRELGELQVVKEIAEEFDVNPAHAYEIIGEALCPQWWLSQKTYLTPKLNDRTWPTWRRRYQWLLERTQFITKELIDRSFVNEFNRESGTSSKAWCDSPEAQRLASRWWNQGRKEWAEYRRAVALKTPSLVELAEFVVGPFGISEDSESQDQTKFALCRAYEYGRTLDNIKAQGAGGFALSKAETDSDDANAEYIAALQEDHENAVQVATVEIKARLKAEDRELGTWAEECPDTYGPEAIAEHAKPSTAKVVKDVTAVLKLALQTKVILLDPDQLARLREWAEARATIEAQAFTHLPPTICNGGTTPPLRGPARIPQAPKRRDDQ